ncbi:pol polyprotein, partial [Vairimorpha apis BRL 01]
MSYVFLKFYSEHRTRIINNHDFKNGNDDKEQLLREEDEHDKVNTRYGINIEKLRIDVKIEDTNIVIQLKQMERKLKIIMILLQDIHKISQENYLSINDYDETIKEHKRHFNVIFFNGVSMYVLSEEDYNSRNFKGHFKGKETKYFQKWCSKCKQQSYVKQHENYMIKNNYNKSVRDDKDNDNTEGRERFHNKQHYNSKIRLPFNYRNEDMNNNNAINKNIKHNDNQNLVIGEKKPNIKEVHMSVKYKGKYLDMTLDYEARLKPKEDIRTILYNKIIADFGKCQIEMEGKRYGFCSLDFESDLDDKPCRNLNMICDTRRLFSLKYKKKLQYYARPEYSVPEKYKERLHEKLNRLEKEEIIERSNSNFSSPAFIVIKKNQEIRLVVDYRHINDHLIDKIVKIPKIHDSIRLLEGKTCYSQIDLKNGFNQLELDAESQVLTGFISFGMKSGPKIFQQKINDIVIYGNDTNEHDQILAKMLKRLYDNEIEVLGCIVNKDEIKRKYSNLRVTLKENFVPNSSTKGVK